MPDTTSLKRAALTVAGLISFFGCWLMTGITESIVPFIIGSILTIVFWTRAARVTRPYNGPPPPRVGSGFSEKLDAAKRRARD